MQTVTATALYHNEKDKTPFEAAAAAAHHSHQHRHPFPPPQQQPPLSHTYSDDSGFAVIASSSSAPQQRSTRVGRWMADEDELLMDAVQRHNGTKWKLIAEEVGTRDGDQCWKRWHDSLNPQLKSSKQWTDDEDAMLQQIQAEIGNKWTEIARDYLPGRSGLQVKNRFDHIKRRRRAAMQQPRIDMLTFNEAQLVHSLQQQSDSLNDLQHDFRHRGEQYLVASQHALHPVFSASTMDNARWTVPVSSSSSFDIVPAHHYSHPLDQGQQTQQQLYLDQPTVFSPIDSPLSASWGSQSQSSEQVAELYRREEALLPPSTTTSSSSQQRPSSQHAPLQVMPSADSQFSTRWGSFSSDAPPAPSHAAQQLWHSQGRQLSDPTIFLPSHQSSQALSSSVVGCEAKVDLASYKLPPLQPPSGQQAMLHQPLSQSSQQPTIQLGYQNSLQQVSSFV